MSNLMSGVNEDVLCDASIESGETDPYSILCHYLRLLDRLQEVGKLCVKDEDNRVRSFKYEADNEGYDKGIFREDRNTSQNVKSKPHVQASEKKTTKEVRRGSLVTKKSVEGMLNTSHVKRKKEDKLIVDETFKSYVSGSLKNSKKSRTNSGKQIQVNCEDNSDSDIIKGVDPILDDEDSPFVPSTDLNDAKKSSLFRKELMNILKQPFTETELKELHKEASVRNPVTRCRQLLDGREISYETNEKSPSYLDKYPAFKKKYIESLREKDGHKALNLLRGFIFYLQNIVQDNAFKPWLDKECLKIIYFNN